MQIARKFHSFFAELSRIQALGTYRLISPLYLRLYCWPLGPSRWTAGWRRMAPACTDSRPDPLREERMELQQGRKLRVSGCFCLSKKTEVWSSNKHKWWPIGDKRSQHHVGYISCITQTICLIYRQNASWDISMYEKMLPDDDKKCCKTWLNRSKFIVPTGIMRPVVQNSRQG